MAIPYRRVQSAPGRPWQYSESESETETETDSSETSSTTEYSYDYNTVRTERTPRGTRRNVKYLYDYTIVKEVPYDPRLNGDKFYYRANGRNSGSREMMRYTGSARRHDYQQSSGRQTTQWNLRPEDQQELKSSSAFEAARIGDMRQLQIIIGRHPHVIRSKNGMGNTPLHIAAEAGKVEIVKWLAANNADLEAETARGFTALHLAALTGQLSCIRVLAAMGANINSVSSKDKKTPLHVAAMMGNMECVKWFVANGCNIYVKDEAGNTPGSLAEQFQHSAVAEFLKTCEKDVSDPNSVFTLMKSDRSDRKDREKAVKMYVSDVSIGTLREDFGGSGLYQPIDIHLPVGARNKIDYVTIYTPSERSVHADVTNSQDGKVIVTFEPTETGLHQLDITYKNKKKGGTIPFIIHAVNTSKIVANGHGLRHTLTNETSNFWIENKDAYTGTPLNVQVGRDSPPPTPPPKVVPAPPPPPPPPQDRRSKCELSLNIPVVTTTAKADIIFALDSSASVGANNFDKQLQFVSKIIQNQRVGPDHVQCSLLTFSSTVRNHFCLDSYKDKESILKDVMRTGYHYGKTFTGEALRYIRKHSLLPSNGARSECQKLVIVLTDGASTNKSVTLYEADRLKKTHDVKVIAIGVGKNVNKEELKAIASDERSVFRASSFNALSSISNQIKLDSKDTWTIRMSCIDQDDGPPSATFNVNYTSPFTMKASVTRPSGDREKCIVNKINNYQYSIKFLPIEVGIHKVEVKEYDTPIPGSPFEFMIDPAKVYTGKTTPDLQPPLPDPIPEPDPEPVTFDLNKKDIKPYEFKVFTREGHSAYMTVSMEGPSKASFKVDNRKNGLCGVSYLVTEPGDYTLSVKCDNEHIEDSPFNVHVSHKCSYVFCDCQEFKRS